MNFDALFTALDNRPIEAVDDIPGLPSGYYMRSLTVQERDDVSRVLFGDKYDRKGVASALINAHSVAAAMCEPDGSRLSKEDSATLVKKLLGGAAGMVDALVARANKVSATGVAAVEEAEKNSDPTGSGDSGTS